MKKKGGNNITKRLLAGLLSMLIIFTLIPGNAIASVQEDDVMVSAAQTQEVTQEAEPASDAAVTETPAPEPAPAVTEAAPADTSVSQDTGEPAPADSAGAESGGDIAAPADGTEVTGDTGDGTTVQPGEDQSGDATASDDKDKTDKPEEGKTGDESKEDEEVAMPARTFFGEAGGVVEGEIVITVAAVVGKGDDEALLHVGVHHGAVNEHSVFVVEGDAHVAETLAEVDIHRVAAVAGTDGVGIGAHHQRALQINCLVSSRDIVLHINNGNVVEVCGLGFPSAKT